MAENMSISLLHVMDHLWFHQVILVPDPISLLITKTSTKTPSQLLSDSQTTSCSSLFSSSCTIEEDTTFEEENSSPSNEEDTLDHLVEEENSYLPLSTPQEESNNEEKEKERPAREKNSIPNYMRIRTRSLSTSPSFHKRSTKHCSKKILEKSMSCRTFGELELEELKGFMDLGFTFKKEEISPKLMILIPGLHRLSLLKNLTRFAANDDHKEVIITKDDSEVMSEEEYNIEDEESIAMNDKKPYLSEAWLIKRPDSPLLNLRVPRFSAASDMKKHLKSWARIVASEIHQET